YNPSSLGDESPYPHFISEFRSKLVGLNRDLPLEGQQFLLGGFLMPLRKIPFGASYRQILLQREIEQGVARHVHLVSLRDDFRACTNSSPDTSADRCPFAAPCDSADDRSHSGSTDR